jgi:hypothetical protein
MSALRKSDLKFAPAAKVFLPPFVTASLNQLFETYADSHFVLAKNSAGFDPRNVEIAERAQMADTLSLRR